MTNRENAGALRQDHTQPVHLSIQMVQTDVELDDRDGGAADASDPTACCRAVGVADLALASPQECVFHVQSAAVSECVAGIDNLVVVTHLAVPALEELVRAARDQRDASVVGQGWHC
jgi:hypothetical protein